MQLRKLTLAALLLLLAACGDVTLPTATAPSATQAPDSTIVATADPNDFAPADNDQPPTFDSGNGAITGILLDMQGQPVVSMAVYLSVMSSGAAGGVIQFDPMSSPMSVTDRQGRFKFSNVPPSATIAPASYTLMTWTPVQTKTVPPEGGAEDTAIVVEVKANQITKLPAIKFTPPE